MKIHGIKYAEGVLIRVSMDTAKYVYTQVIAIYIIDEIKVFLGRIMEIKSYDSHTRSYTVSPSNSMLVATYQDLYRHGVLHLHKNRIVEKDSAKIYDSE